MLAISEDMRITGSSLLLFVSQHVPVLSGHATMDSVFTPPNIVMGTGSAQMAVMNSTAVSTGLLTITSLLQHVSGSFPTPRFRR